MSYRDTMRSLAATTAPDDNRVARVHSRLAPALLSTADLLAHVPVPAPGAAARVRRRLAMRPAPVAPWRLGGLAAMAAVGAAALLWIAWPSPNPVPLSGALALGSVEVAPGVRLELAGTGALAGTDRDPHISWDAGRVAVDVEPGGAGVVVVETREAHVQVVGTGFEVERDALGTHVSVTRGIVEVRCLRASGGDVQRLDSGSSTDCLPVSAAGMLGRGQALHDRGAAPAEVLAALAEAESMVGGGDVAVHTEILAEAVGRHLELGDRGAARGAAERALALGEGPRDQELHRAAATLWLLEDACDRAVPHLAALSTLSEPERAHLDRCRGR